MAFLWHFSSYDHSKFAILDAATISSALLWDDGAIDDVYAVERVAEHIAANGICYDSLTSADSELLDELIPGIFSPEGLNEVLHSEPESEEGVHPSIIQEMLIAHSAASILPWLIHGRRHHCSRPDVACSYVMLDPSKISQLLAECELILESNTSWSEKYLPDVIRECLIEPLKSIKAKGKHAVGILG